MGGQEAWEDVDVVGCVRIDVVVEGVEDVLVREALDSFPCPP